MNRGSEGVLDRLRRHGPAGIPFADARRLLLALWLPPRREPDDAGIFDRLAAVFEALAQDARDWRPASTLPRPPPL